jgi:hypothetical protein
VESAQAAVFGASDVLPPPGVDLLLKANAQKGTFMNPIPSSPHGLLLRATVCAYLACFWSSNVHLLAFLLLTRLVIDVASILLEV